MRLWSIHPCYLDAKGLLALWREGLLAQKVLLGNTRGYRNHPQLMRFRNTDNPAGAVAVYLRHVADEADRRGYRFDRGRISKKRFKGKIPITEGQIEFEFSHLLGKLDQRSPGLFEKHRAAGKIRLHPMMQRVRGVVEDWEIRGDR